MLDKIRLIIDYVGKLEGWGYMGSLGTSLSDKTGCRDAIASKNCFQPGVIRQTY